MPNVSILVCSYQGSKYLSRTLASIMDTARGFDYELLLDVEKERTGLVNTPKRYQQLFDGCRGKYVVKSDDDVLYFPGWLEACIAALDGNPDIGYVSPLNHWLLFRLGKKDLHVDQPIHAEGHPEPSHFLSGACWVMREDLWCQVPYGNLNGIRSLDSNFGAAVRKLRCLMPAYLPSVLCSHLGTDRHGGIDV